MSTAVVSKFVKRLLATRTLRIKFENGLSLWTSENIVKSPFKDMDIPNRTLPEQIWENLDRWADKTAMICGLRNKFFTYEQLYRASRNFAVKLRTCLHIRDGDTICIMAPNMPEYPIAVLGALEAGAVVTTVNHIYKPYEVHKQILQSRPKIFIGSPKTVPTIKETFKLAKKEVPIIMIIDNIDELPLGTISFQELAFDNNVDHSVLKEVRRNPDDIALLPYSSGTTGMPKGVELMNKCLVANFIQQDVKEVRHYFETTSSHQDVVLGVLPFYHLYGLAVVLLHKLSIGAKMVILPKFQPNTYLTALKEHKINLLHTVPPMVQFLGSNSNAKAKDMDSIKIITCAAAPLPKHDVDKVLEKVKPDTTFIQMYGMTETSPLVTSLVPGSMDYTTCGFAVSNTELKIVDKNSRTLGPNELGELFIRGPQMMKGYRDNPEATKASITEDGWYKSGDLARIDEDGTLVVADRLKELIKVKSYQVAPAELESILKEHPNIEEVAVIGIPDQKLGEVPRAFVVLKNGHKVEDYDIMNFLAEKVAEYKRVKQVTFLDSLPKSTTGKILKRSLRDEYC